ncbi:hypothetical protein LSH36_44g12046 [Paralvinella palmiformis]|uniref:PIH1D1/2/3 CS-like domain-containing protein n=1 Tax=Paralvinella palmiformis TaxID=53620 RepID=A0AAD9K8F5_9ANNE|nr:hypothetical protein LSH36_44g12046 [Paralvinella palmiformis]
MELGNLDLKCLANMLKEPTVDDSDSEDDAPKTSVAKLGPGDVGSKDSESKPSKSIYAKKKNTASKDIWDPDEIVAGAEYEDIYDPRIQPEYEIIYKQAVTSEDMFLQMGNKTPSTASCEDMLVKIKLPGTKMADVKLDCKDTFLDCRSPKYKLGLHLPHSVDSKNGKAKWDSDTETLSVTLRMQREFDFINF